ncbi:hypothetical protein Gotur_024089 [Gossypium turneri]
MEKGFLDKVEDNAAVRTWAEAVQREKGDSLAERYVSELWDFTRISVTQNSLQELKEIWDQWNNEVRQLFYSNYGDLPYLLDMKVYKHLFRALAQFWNTAYGCFTFGRVDLVPTVEEYTALLRCLKIQVDRAYSRAVSVPTFLKKLMSITGMSKQWVTARIKQKGDSKCIPWKNLKDIILAHPDTKKKIDVFVLSIYGLVIFPRLWDMLMRQSLTCSTDLIRGSRHHFWKVDKVSYWVFFENYSPQKEIVATPRMEDISEERWATILQNLQEKDVEWTAPWLLPDEILFRCGDFDWVPLLGIWGAIGYAPLLVLRQYRSRQFIPATRRLAECEFSYRGDGCKKKIREISNTWNQTRRMKRLAVGQMTTPEYNEWWQDFEKKNAELEKKIEQLEKEKIHLGLDVDIQKLETEKLRKGKKKAEEDLDSLKIDYKKLRLSIRTAGLGKTSEQ